MDKDTISFWTQVDPTRLQNVVRKITRRIGRWWCRYEQIGRENIPVSGPTLLCPNHGSNLDGFYFLHGTERPMRFMAKYQVLEWPLIGKLVRLGGGFPVKRGYGDKNALEVGRQLLLAGHALCIFPEGTLVRTPELGRSRSGAAVLALQTAAEVVPVAAWGNKPNWVYQEKQPRLHKIPIVGFIANLYRPRVTVCWGTPFRLTDVPISEPTQEQIDEAREKIWAQVQTLHERAHENQTKVQ